MIEAGPYIPRGHGPGQCCEHCGQREGRLMTEDGDPICSACYENAQEPREPDYGAVGWREEAEATYYAKYHGRY